MEEGIKSTSTATQKILTNQVMIHVPNAKRDKYTSSIQEKALLEANIKKEMKNRNKR